MSSARILRIIYEKDGREFVARLSTDEEREHLREILKNSGKPIDGCSCGEEFCDGEWMWRCMASGGGRCEWFVTYEVCNEEEADTLKCCKFIDSGNTKDVVIYNSCDDCMQAKISWGGSIHEEYRVEAHSSTRIKMKGNDVQLIDEIKCPSEFDGSK